MNKTFLFIQPMSHRLERKREKYRSPNLRLFSDHVTLPKPCWTRLRPSKRSKLSLVFGKG